MITRASVKARPLAKNPVNAGHANIVKILGLVSHRFGCYQRFFRNRNICSAGASNEDLPFAVLGLVPMNQNGS
jgi:hypothetical protein